MKLKGLVAACIAAAALVFAAVAAAALEPWTFTDTGVTCAVSSTFSNGVLHLSKPCTTDTVASAGATITDASGTFTSASFTLASASQCQGGSPRFNVETTTGFFFLGCNNVVPNGSTYTFTPATLAAAGESDLGQSRTSTAQVSVRQAAARAVANLADHQPVRAGSSASVTSKRSGSRMQQMMGGGGGKGAMVMGLVYTVVGLGATVYMLKTLQEKQKENQ